MTEPTEEDMAVDLALCLRSMPLAGCDPDTLIYMWLGDAEAALRRALWAEAEVERLRAMYEAACARIAGQSDLLSRRAEK